MPLRHQGCVGATDSLSIAGKVSHVILFDSEETSSLWRLHSALPRCIESFIRRSVRYAMSLRS